MDYSRYLGSEKMKSIYIELLNDIGDQTGECPEEFKHQYGDWLQKNDTIRFMDKYSMWLLDLQRRGYYKYPINR